MIELNRSELSEIAIAFLITFINTNKGLESYHSFLRSFIINEVVINGSRALVGIETRPLETIVIILFATGTAWASRAFINEAFRRKDY